MRLRNGVAVCAVSALAMVFSVQQGQHGPLVVYKLQVPKAPTVESRTVQVPAATPQAGGPETQPVPSRAPRSLGTVVMPASALPPPRVTPVPVAVIPAEAPPPTAEPLPTATATVPASPQPRVLGTVALSEIESLTDDAPVPLMPSSQEVFHIVEESGFGSATINEDAGDSLTLQEVNDAAVWRRDTAERLRQIPIAPRF